MRAFNYIVTDPIGLHARPAGLLVKEVKKYDSLVTISKEGTSTDAKKLMMLMALGVKCGDEITVEVTGPDEDVAVSELEEFFKANL